MRYPQSKLAACECGRYRKATRVCCAHCETLDGIAACGRPTQRYAVFDVIQVLRAADRALSMREIAAQTGHDSTDAGLYRMLLRLVRQGRLRRFPQDYIHLYADHFVLKN